MKQDMIELTLALYWEHHQRTGHEPRATDGVLRCNVCLWLRDLLDRAESASVDPTTP